MAADVIAIIILGLCFVVEAVSIGSTVILIMGEWR